MKRFTYFFFSSRSPPQARRFFYFKFNEGESYGNMLWRNTRHGVKEREFSLFLCCPFVSVYLPIYLSTHISIYMYCLSKDWELTKHKSVLENAQMLSCALLCECRLSEEGARVYASTRQLPLSPHHVTGRVGCTVTKNSGTNFFNSERIPSLSGRRAEAPC